MPIVDDPFDFGRIAATNALSDVYAMGGTPILALAIVGMPVDKLPIDDDAAHHGGRRGGVRARPASRVAGGHSIDSPEPIYGLAALGLVASGPRQAQRRRARRATCSFWASRSASAS